MQRDVMHLSPRQAAIVLMLARMRVAGGPGSGNFGHGGRKGEIGGSSSANSEYVGSGSEGLEKLSEKHGDVIPARDIFYHTNPDDQAEIVSIGNAALERDKFELRQVPVKDLWTVQEDVSLGGLMGEGNGGPIDVLDFDGKLHIIDGNNRTGSAIIHGQRTIAARVYKASGLKGLARKASTRRDHNLIHAAADSQLQSMLLAVNYAFMRGRKAYKSGGTQAAIKAIRAALLESLPPVLLKTLVAGGEVALQKLPKQRAAGGAGSGNFGHGGRPGEVGGSGEGEVFHGTPQENLVSILKSGILAPKGDRVYAALKRSEAEFWARNRGGENGAHVAVLRIQVPAKDWAKAQARYKGVTAPYRQFDHIPAAWIKEVSTGRTSVLGPAKFTKLSSKQVAKLKGLSGDFEFYVAVDLPSNLRALKPKVGISFSVSDPNAVAWAQEHAAELADGISATSLERIQDAVARAVGGEGIDAAYDEILDAVGSEARADVIARTEIMDAANEGLAQGWAQAQEEGLLSGDAKKVWIATSGCCDDCDDLDGEEVLLSEDFSIGDDPPAHPSCRCTMGIA